MTFDCRTVHVMRKKYGKPIKCWCGSYHRPALVTKTILPMAASKFVKEVGAVLTGLLQGRASCEGKISFRIEGHKPVTFSVMIADPSESGGH